MSPEARPIPRSPWKLGVATVAGIPVRVHATFLLFLGWIAYVAGLSGAALVAGLFLCVLLHEFGHALTARRYGVGTRDITLYPIGGLAMLDGRLRARQELWVALAGPAVNLAIVGVILLGTTLAGRQPFDTGTYFGALAASNLLMAGFNMLPAFPMDGGRVLRALLARRMPDERATRIAAGVGQVAAVGLFLYGLLAPLPLLAFVAVFVFLGAGQERRSETMRSRLEGHRLSEAMRTDVRTLAHGASLGSAVETLREAGQKEYPVVAADEVVGIVSRDAIARGFMERGPNGFVAGDMRRGPKTAPPETPLVEAVALFTPEDPSAVLVMEDGHLLGMVTTENVGEFLTREDGESLV